eukprot:8381623-Lingulodinium_polyedra.AAC.1
MPPLEERATAPAFKTCPHPRNVPLDIYIDIWMHMYIHVIRVTFVMHVIYVTRVMHVIHLGRQRTEGRAQCPRRRRGGVDAELAFATRPR